MGSIRLYTGDDGQSHIEEIDPTEHPDWNTLHAVKGIVPGSIATRSPGTYCNASAHAYCPRLSASCVVT